MCEVFKVESQLGEDDLDNITAYGTKIIENAPVLPCKRSAGCGGYSCLIRASNKLFYE